MRHLADARAVGSAQLPAGSVGSGGDGDAAVAVDAAINQEAGMLPGAFARACVRSSWRQGAARMRGKVVASSPC